MHSQSLEENTSSTVMICLSPKPCLILLPVGSCNGHKGFDCKIYKMMGIFNPVLMSFEQARLRHCNVDWITDCISLCHQSHQSTFSEPSLTSSSAFYTKLMLTHVCLVPTATSFQITPYAWIKIFQCSLLTSSVHFKSSQNKSNIIESFSSNRGWYSFLSWIAR